MMACTTPQTFKHFAEDLTCLEEFRLGAYLKDGNAEQQRGDPYPPYLDAIKSTLWRHPRIKQLVRSNLSENPLIVFKLVTSGSALAWHVRSFHFPLD